MLRKLTIVSFVGLMMTLLLILTGCSSTSGTAEANKTSAYPTTVNVGIIEGGPESAILAEEGYLQKYIKTKVKVTTYSSGTDINNAFISHTLDFASFGSSPVTLGLVNGVSYKAVAVPYTEGGQIEALVARNGTGIKSVKDLKGKTIGVPAGTTSHYALLQALKLAGLSTSDVTIEDLSGQNIVAAWKRKEIDAAYTWSPSLDSIKKTGTVITSDGQLASQGISIPEIAVATNNMMTKYPKVVAQYVKAMLAVGKLVKTNPQRAIADVASWEGISKSAAKAQIEDNHWLTGSEQLSSLTGTGSGSLVETLQLTAQFHKLQENITTVPSRKTLSATVDNDYLAEALGKETGK